MRRVIMGAGASPVRRPDDAAGDAGVGLGRALRDPLGTFDVDGSQIALRTVGSGLTGLDDSAMYGISIEPGRKAPSEPTEVVATGQVTS